MRIAQQQQRAERIGIGGVFPVRRRLHVALRSQIVDFDRLRFLPETDQVCRIRRVAVMLLRTLITEIPLQGSTLGAGASPR